MLRENCVEVSTSFGSTSEKAGISKTSSKVKPSWISLICIINSLKLKSQKSKSPLNRRAFFLRYKSESDFFDFNLTKSCIKFKCAASAFLPDWQLLPV